MTSDEELGSRVVATGGHGGRAAVRWSALSLVGRNVVALAATVLVARLAGADAYGVMSQAAVYIAITMLIVEGGLGSWLIQSPSLDAQDIRSVTGLNLAFGGVAAVATVAAAPIIASFFRTAAVEDVLRVLSLGVLLKAMSVTPRSLLMRDLRFRELAAAEFLSAVMGATVGVVMAAQGAEHWSLVGYAMTTDATYLAAVAIPAGGLRPSLRFARLRVAWRFSTSTLGASVLNYATRNVDNMIVGRRLGPTALGHYALSYRTILLVTQNLSALVNRVAFPLFSRLSDDVPRQQRVFLQATAAVSLVSFPMMVGVMLAAPLAIPLALGGDWRPAIVPMQVLAVTGLRQSVTSLAGPVYLAAGRSDLLLKFNVVNATVSIVSFLVGVRWGIVGVAVAYAVVGSVLGPAAYALVSRVLHLGLREYVAALMPAAVAAAALALVWGVATIALDRAGTIAPTWRLALSAAAAAGGYLAVLVLAFPSSLRLLASFARPGRLPAV